MGSQKDNISTAKKRKFRFVKKTSRRKNKKEKNNLVTPSLSKKTTSLYDDTAVSNCNSNHLSAPTTDSTISSCSSQSLHSSIVDTRKTNGKYND